MTNKQRQTLLFSATLTASLQKVRGALLGLDRRHDAPLLVQVVAKFDVQQFGSEASDGSLVAELRQEYVFVPAKLKEVPLAALEGCAQRSHTLPLHIG